MAFDEHAAVSSDRTWTQLNTSYRVTGEANVDEFAGLCAALGLRPHQLVRRLVDEGVARYRQDRDLDKVIRLVCEGRRHKRASDQGAAADLNCGRLIDARDRFRSVAPLRPCRECGAVGTTYVMPHVDHRRRKPWPQPYWLCEAHSTGAEQ